MKPSEEPRQDEPPPGEDARRTAEARRIIEEYAGSLRQFLKKLGRT